MKLWKFQWMAVLKEAVESFADEAYVTGKVEVADQSATSILRRASLKPSGSSGEASSDPTATAATGRRRKGGALPGVHQPTAHRRRADTGPIRVPRVHDALHRRPARGRRVVVPLHEPGR